MIEHFVGEGRETSESLIDTIPAAVYRCSVDDERRPIFVSDYIVTITGFDPECFDPQRGRSLSSLVHPDDRERVLARIAEAIRAGEVYDLEYRILRADGEVRWVYDRGRQVATGGSNPPLAQGVIGDVTARHQAMQEREQMLSMLNAFFDHSPHEIIVKDVEGRYLFFNKHAETLWGVQSDQAVGCLPSDLFPASFADGFQAAVLRVAETGKTVTVEEQVPTVNGTITQLCVRFPILDSQGNITSIGSIATDITEVKRAGALIDHIARALSPIAGEQYFHLLVEHLARGLDMDIALVGELHPEIPDRIRTIAIFVDGRHAENCEYDLPDTPCASLFDSSACVFRAEVQALFPRDRMLADLKIEAYAGSPLRDSRGESLGVLVVLNRRPIDKPEEVSKLLQIFAARASVELERQRRHQALQRSEERYRAFLAHSTDAIWRFDLVPGVAVELPAETQVARICHESVLAECNPAMAHLHGLDGPEQIIGKGLGELGRGRDVESLVRRFVQDGYRLTHAEFPDLSGRIDAVHTAVSASGIVEDGRLIRIWGTDRDITDKYRHQAELEHRATHDSLTQLPNRDLLRNRLEHSLRTGEASALLLMDLDRFKEINDTLGHQAGDSILKELAHRLREVSDRCGRGCVVARLGGDEFAMLCPATSERAEALDLARRIQASVSRPFEINGLRMELGSSIGISMAPSDGTEASELLRRADVAMYRAKTNGQDCACYHVDLDQHSLERLSLMSDLAFAAGDGQLLLEYQPKIRLDGREGLGLEALVRWQHPVHGRLSPGEFIPLAEMSDSMVSITRWVIDRALQDWRNWSKLGLAPTVAINLSARDLVDERLADDIAGRLERNGVPAAALECEITESALITDPERAHQTVRRLSRLGVRFAIDDFGTGYSSLALLKSLPLDALKIDRSFVGQMTRDESDAAIVRSTIGLANNLNLTVVAEGVENRPTWVALRDAGCDFVQGFYIARPIPADEVVGWARRARMAC